MLNADQWNYFYAPIAGRPGPDPEAAGFFPAGERGFRMNVDGYLDRMMAGGFL